MSSKVVSPSAAGLGAAARKLTSRIAIANKAAEAARRKTKTAKGELKAAKKKWKEAKRAAKAHRKDVKSLKTELASLVSKAKSRPKPVRKKPVAPMQSAAAVEAVPAPAHDTAPASPVSEGGS